MTEPTYWTTRDGKSISIDDMDANHVRNAFKMLIRRHQKQTKLLNLLIDKLNKPFKAVNVSLKGEIAIAFNQDMEDAEMIDDYYNN